MPIDRDYSDVNAVLILIEEAQDSERNRRDKVKEAKCFLTKRDGMWHQDSWDKMAGHYRGTFDMCTPIVDGIAGEIDQSDFTLRVSPSGGRASEDTARTLDGLIRNIRNISNAEDTFNKAGRSNVVGGFDAWEVVQDWIDGDSFDQDLFIRRIPDAAKSVWFDMASVMQAPEDANWAIKLVGMPIADYQAKWPDGSLVSIGDNSRVPRDKNNPKEIVTVGQLYFKKPIEIDLVRMNNGDVYQDDDKFKAAQDELAEQGITIEVDDEGEEKRRTRKSWRVHSRMLDGSMWLAEEEETVFDFIPIVPIYGNYDFIDDERVYFGKIENLLDPQRAYNYAVSRDIEDGALSPAATTWMTDKQAEGNDYSKMNFDRAPIRIYNNDTAAKSPPFKTQGPQASAGLQTTMANMQQMITVSSNTFNAQQGNASSTQSGVAGLQQIEQGNIGSIKWFKDLEIAICYTGKVLISGAISRVYDGTRLARILGEDGTSKMVDLNKQVFDDEAQANVTLNDLSIGEYDVVCEVGPAFNSAQKEAARAFEAIASVSPDVAARNMDIWLKNKKEPGMDMMAEREREALFNAGQIPQSQWTDEEQQKVAEAQAQAAQQPPQEDPILIAARGAEAEGQAAILTAQNKQAEIQGNQQLSVMELQLKDKQLDLDTQKFIRAGQDKFNVEAAKIGQGATKLDQSQQSIDQKDQQMLIDAQQNQDKIDLQAREQVMAEQQQQLDSALKIQQEQREELTAAISDLKTLREAMGVATIVGPHSTEAYVSQAVAVTEIQEESGIDTEIGETVAGTAGDEI